MVDADRVCSFSLQAHFVVVPAVIPLLLRSTFIPSHHSLSVQSFSTFVVLVTESSFKVNYKQARARVCVCTLGRWHTFRVELVTFARAVCAAVVILGAAGCNPRMRCSHIRHCTAIVLRQHTHTQASHVN
jgi:hypothetical protein